MILINGPKESELKSFLQEFNIVRQIRDPFLFNH